MPDFYVVATQRQVSHTSNNSDPESEVNYKSLFLSCNDAKGVYVEIKCETDEFVNDSYTIYFETYIFQRKLSSIPRLAHNQIERVDNRHGLSHLQLRINDLTCVTLHNLSTSIVSRNVEQKCKALLEAVVKSEHRVHEVGFPFHYEFYFGYFG